MQLAYIAFPGDEHCDLANETTDHEISASAQTYTHSKKETVIKKSVQTTRTVENENQKNL